MRMTQILWNSGAQMMFSNLRVPEGKEHWWSWPRSSITGCRFCNCFRDFGWLAFS